MEQLSNTFLKIGGLMVGSTMFMNSFFFTVDAGERAIVFNTLGGIQQTIYGEGMHFYWPVIERPVIYETRVRPKMITSSSGTKDLQTVDIALRLLYRPIEDCLPKIYKNIGIDYENKIIPSIGNEVLKSVVAQYDADQLLKQRERISNEIREQLTSRAQQFSIALEDVSFTDLRFSKEYSQAIEQKQVAQQLAERQRFIVMRDEEEKNAQIIRSEGESEAAKLINDSVKQFGSAQIEIKRLQAAKSIADVLSKSSNISFVPTGGNGGGNILLNIRN